MRALNFSEYTTVSGGLSDRQSESLLGKVGAYTANVALFGGLCVAGVIAPKVFLLTAAAAVVKIGGTYVFYENKAFIMDYVHEAQDYLFPA